MDSNNTERAILSALLLNNAIWPQLTGVDPSDFSLEANRQIFRVSADLLHAGQPADVTTVVDELERRVRALAGDEGWLPKSAADA